MLTATATAYLLKPSACALIRSRRLPTGISVVRRNTKSHRRKSFATTYAPCREVWQRGEKVNRYIGYDAGEVKRYEHSRKYNEADKKYHNRYPLIAVILFAASASFLHIFRPQSFFYLTFTILSSRFVNFFL